MQSSSDRLRKISKNDLEKLGLNGLAYIRPIIVDNKADIAGGKYHYA